MEHSFIHTLKHNISQPENIWLARTCVFLCTLGLLLSGCINDEPSPDDLLRGNTPPVADAGPDQAVERGATVALDGSQSFDSEGTALSFRWRILEQPIGSAAAITDPASPTPTFVADVDGLYRVELIVGEIVDINLPANVPGAGEAGASSEPDEVAIFAGAPGPFTDSGNKLLLDGLHFGTTLLPMTIGGDANLTAEAWVWINNVPAATALIMGKEGVFDLVLRSDGTVAFQWFLEAGGGQTGGLPLSLQTWHHLAAVIDRSRSLAFLALDGKIMATATLSGNLNTNTLRFNVGGRDGSGFLTGMIDEVRVTDNVRYTSDFDPPLVPLLADIPFVENFQNSVHGLWHFDELAGITLFADQSLRTNDLFLVAQKGFRPLTRMLNARINHRALVLGNRIWIAGGLNATGQPVVQSESIGSDDQVKADADLFVTARNPTLVIDRPTGLGDGEKDFNFSVQTSPPISELSVSADTLRGLDNGAGAIIGTGISTGTVNYVNGQVSITFAPADPAPTAGTLRIIAGGLTAVDDGSGNLFINGLDEGDITGKVATVTFPAPLTPGSIKVLANTLTANFFDTNGNTTSTPTGSGIVSGNYNETNGRVDVNFNLAPVANEPLRISYNFTPNSGISDHSLTALQDVNGRVLITGGTDLEGIGPIGLNAAARYDPTPDPTTISAVGNLNTPRRFHTAGLLNNGNVLVVGGESFDGNTQSTLNTVEIYDASNGTFSDADTSLSTERRHHKMIALKDCNPNEDRLLVTGGYGMDNQPLASAERYNGSIFQSTGAMKKQRVRHAMVCLPDGRVLVTGGIDETGRILRTAEIYDPGSGLFSQLESQMVFARAEHTATLLPDKTILIVGGLDFLGPHASAEIYNPDTQNFSRISTSNMAFARYGHVALPWKNGVAIIGGGNTQGQAIPLVEFYLP